MLPVLYVIRVSADEAVSVPRLPFLAVLRIVWPPYRALLAERTPLSSLGRLDHYSGVRDRSGHQEARSNQRASHGHRLAPGGRVVHDEPDKKYGDHPDHAHGVDDA